MNELINWLDKQKICYSPIDSEVLEIEGFGKMFLADLSNARSIFRGTKEELIFNLMESPEILMEEGIFYVAFPFGDNYYYYDMRQEFQFNILKHIGKRIPPQKNVSYVNLGVHTGYELLNGSGDLEQWTKKALQMGHKAIGICDYHTMAACLSLQKQCDKVGLTPVFGYSFTLEHGDSKIELKIYCQSQRGLKNLLRIQKFIMVDSSSNTITLTELLERGKGNVLVLGKLSSHWMKGNHYVIHLLKEAFDKLYYQVDLSEYKAERIDLEVLQATRFFFSNFYDNEACSFEVEPILICDNYYIDKDEARNKILLNKISRGAAHNQSDDQYFKDVDEHFATIVPLFNADMWDIDKLFKKMCDNTLYIAEHASARFETGKMYMPRYIMRDEEKMKYKRRGNVFLKLLQEGLETKIPFKEHPRYRQRLEEEVYIIESTNNVDYFLVQWDMVQEARRRGITVGIGRGSAGGSLVSYLLGITSIDPIKYDLLFSRFLVPERCGLIWCDNVTVIGEDVLQKAGEKAIKITLSGKPYLFFRNARLRVRRDEVEMSIKACELKIGDEIILDNRDILWTLEEIDATK